MTAIASRGLDLYIKKNDQWIFAGAGRPGDSESTTHKIVSNMADGDKECLLFLPLYDEMLSLEIGIKEGTTIYPLQVRWKARIVIYGSSITQGASASRPGMAYPAQLSRDLGYEVVNLGFSGSGKMEESVGRMVADVDDADLFILDCAANPSPEQIAERTESFVKQIRARHPHVPILMIESVVREGGNFDQKVQKRVSDQNTNFRNAYTRLVENGMEQLYLINGDDLLGHDHEGTADGTHPNDLGFDRMLKVIEPKVREIMD
jgi:lysophospholipase L1-like esterase